MAILLDDDQKQAVETNSNAVVAAGAGSGKTRVLARRFLRLIVEGRASVSEILTLTFTKKAAAEMKERIYRLLLEERGNPLAAKALDEFGSSYITTIDSFCTQIVKSGGRAFGIPAGASVDTQAERTLAERESYQFILEHSGNRALHTLIYTHGFERVWKELFADLAANEFSVAGIHDYPGVCEAQIFTCGERIRNNLPRLHELLLSMASLEPQGAKMTGGIKAIRSFLSENEELFSDSRQDYSGLSRLPETLALVKSSAKKGDALLYRELRDEAETLVADISSAAAYLEHQELYRELYSLIQTFQTRFLEAKRRSGLLGFRDLLLTANAVLINDTGLRTYYKNLFSYIMIDEFQDNNRLQRDLLFLLAEDGNQCGAGVPGIGEISSEKLFFVGDAKQSIYLFRGADVRVFKELGTEIKHAGGRLLSLGTNYRSHPGLISLFNDLFPAVMRNDGELYEAEYAPLGARSETAGEFSMSVRLIQDTEEFTDGEHLSREETEAYAAANFILEACSGTGITVLKNGIDTVPDFSDFALLMRSSGSQMQYEKIFRRMGIPYTADNVRSLFLEAPANDIYGILQLALIPGDRFAYAIVLRSPFGGLDDTVVCRLLREDIEPFSLSSEELGLDTVQKQKYDACRTILSKLRERIDILPIHQCIEFLWYDTGYRYSLLKNPDYHGYLEFIDYLRAIAMEFDSRGDSMVLFLEFLSKNLGQYQKLDELSIVKDEENSVQIMSIHKSKGLEFPVVIIGSAGKNSSDRQSTRPYYVSEQHGLSVHLMRDSSGRRVNPFYDGDREMQKCFEQAELKRLLYVACTRAEQHLLVVGSRTSQNRNQDSHILNLVLSAMNAGDDPLEHPSVTEVPPVLRDQFFNRFRGGRGTDTASLLQQTASAPAEVIRTEERSFAATALNTAYAGIHVMEKDVYRELPPLSCDHVIQEMGIQKQFGVLVHLMCEYIIKDRYSRDIIPFSLLDGIDDAIRPLLLEDAEGLCSAIPEAILQNRSRAVLEEPFTMLIPDDPDKRFVEGQFDCYLETPEGVVLYDFKTDAVIRPGEYDFQLALYRYALSEITGKPAESYLVYLRNGETIRVDAEPDWSLLPEVFNVMNA